MGYRGGKVWVERRHCMDVAMAQVRLHKLQRFTQQDIHTRCGKFGASGAVEVTHTGNNACNSSKLLLGDSEKGALGMIGVHILLDKVEAVAGRIEWVIDLVGH